jgi:hypothetical protein
MNFKAALSKFLTNKWVLNIISILAFFNVIGYLIMGNLNTVLFFIIIAVLIRYFSKNMIIVLGIPLILVNLLSLKGGIMEGLENNSSPLPATSTDTKMETQMAKNKQQDAKSKQGLPITPIDDSVKTTNTDTNNAISDESFEVGRSKNRGYNIDYASTIEDAYDELNKILGSDGIKRLTGDTQTLMKQQMQLAESMKSMAPMIQSMAPMMKQAQDMLGGMGEGKEGLGGIMEIAKKLTSKTN